ncbi:MAG: hypothetical protein OXE84_09155, partial [Rhodobacteraceae bacterium]|nr:hypothetical protein [Paracoccaceae bacterium]
ASITWPTPAHVMGILCQDRLVCVEPRRAPGTLSPLSGIGGGLEIWAGLPDIYPPDVWRKTFQKGPVVPAPSAMATIFSARPCAAACCITCHTSWLIWRFRQVLPGSGSRAKVRYVSISPVGAYILNYPNNSQLSH